MSTTCGTTQRPNKNECEVSSAAVFFFHPFQTSKETPRTGTSPSSPTTNTDRTKTCKPLLGTTDVAPSSNYVESVAGPPRSDTLESVAGSVALGPTVGGPAGIAGIDHEHVTSFVVVVRRRTIDESFHGLKKMTGGGGSTADLDLGTNPCGAKGTKCGQVVHFKPVERKEHGQESIERPLTHEDVICFRGQQSISCENESDNGMDCGVMIKHANPLVIGRKTIVEDELFHGLKKITGGGMGGGSSGVFDLLLTNEKEIVGHYGIDKILCLGPGEGIEDVMQRACNYAKQRGYEHIGDGAVL